MEDCAQVKRLQKTILAIVFTGLNLGAFSTWCSSQEFEPGRQLLQSATVPDVPYQAIVVSSDAKVHSGPGDMHYATQILEQNSTVQVYRHDPGGWCAIRPPLDSFSLVPKTAIEIGDNGEGKVTEDGIMAWVGTTAGPVDKPLWQVKLKKGETVYLLGETSWPNPEGHSTTWLHILPPNGEFRWIHLDDIRLPISEIPNDRDATNLQTSESSLPDPTQNDFELDNEGWRPAKVPFKKQNEIQLVSAQEYESSTARGATNLNPTKPGSNGSPPQRVFADRFEDQPNQEGFVTPEVDANTFQQLNQALSQRRPAIDNSITPVTNQLPTRQNGSRPERFASADASIAPFVASQTMAQMQSLREIQPIGSIRLSPRLLALDLKLNSEVIKPQEKWELQNLGASVQEIINSPADATELNAAQRLLLKIQNFQAIRENSRVQSEVKPADQFTGGEQSGIYDASGWLSELVRNRGTVDSTYVLLDDSGRITHHVRPAPGLNLHRYLDNKVGIIGQRGYHQELKLNHVVAERITVLQKSR